MKVYFITGASSGFGAALAEAVLERGDAAIVTARRTEALNAIADRYPDTALAVRLDVTDAQARTDAVHHALERFGRIDVLANIAGRGSMGAAEEFTPEQLRAQMELNFFGAAEMTRALLPTFRAQGSGHVLQLTSVGGLLSMGGCGAYCASKFALEGWSEALRDEVKPLGIRVTIVEPGAFRTEFAGDVIMRAQDSLDAYRPIIEPLERYILGSDDQQAGDPVKAAQAMIQVVESDDPPLRLLLGQDAYDAWGNKRASLDAEFEAWRAVGTATAFPGAKTHAIGGKR